MAISPEQRGMPSHWQIYASVGNCDETLANAAEMGARILVPGQDVPGVGRFGVIADPTGAAIAVIQLTVHA